ncbi:MAG: hypothetical protein HQL69_12415 [Magnetococcales bacterium]|nr:hypothetical protein [Magnetococcales bacterium]
MIYYNQGRERPFSALQEKDGCAVGGLFCPKGVKVDAVLKSLEQLEHRGSGVPDYLGRISGDGTGLLMRMPLAAKSWLAQINPDINITGEPFEQLAIGMFFLPQDTESTEIIKQQSEMVFQKAGFEFIGWRKVPTNHELAQLGVAAVATMPDIHQAMLLKPHDINGEEFEKALFIARKKIETRLTHLNFSIASLSCRVVNYKGMLNSKQFGLFYEDFQSDDNPIISNIYVFHRRFSTNTYPNWFLAQPFRLLGHNGEINSIAANRDAVRNIEDPTNFIAEDSEILMKGGSDSADLDRVVEFFYFRNYGLALTMMALIPPAWGGDTTNFDHDTLQFLSYHKLKLGTLGQWEGPAGVVATDGYNLVAKEDRIALRPLRWAQLKDGSVWVTSEIGSFPLDVDEIVSIGKLGSGQLLQVNSQSEMEFDDQVIKRELSLRPELCKKIASAQVMSPYPAIAGLPEPKHLDLKKTNRINCFSRHNVHAVETLMQSGTEPTGAMGKQYPAAALLASPSSIYDYFLQLFAQITNPPIDFIREKKFFDLRVFLGNRTGNQAMEFPSPNLDLAAIRFLENHPWTIKTDILFFADNDKDATHKRCLERMGTILDEIKSAIKSDKYLVILHDDNIDENFLAIPGPILGAFLHHGLTKAGLRQHCCLILKANDVREPHDIAVNLAFGLNAVHPSLIWKNGISSAKKIMDKGSGDWSTLAKNLQSGLDKSLLKIMSKMGVTTTAGYRDSQLFMPFGLAGDIQQILNKHDEYNLGGRNLGDILALQRLLVLQKDDSRTRVDLAWDLAGDILNQVGIDGNPDHLARLEQERKNPFKLIHLLDFQYPKVASRDFSETVQEVVSRYFVGAAMSHGALKDVAHRAIAAAFNDFGARSNSGEGGESADRDRTKYNNRIRQVASGRFGVEARYLVFADEIQIKIAQGAKPGEGGQLMGVKVDEVIAKNRNCAPGTTLISPQTHQDIYSIEDLKQLIHDIKSINPKAAVSVKIAAEFGVGIIAVGAAKMFADIIEIDGLDGGTGATPVSSREHAAHYAEVGLVETHQALIKSGLRRFVVLRVASGIKSGADIVKYAALGADEFSIGTSLLVAMGCTTCAQCFSGSCPTAITGNPDKKKIANLCLEERIQGVKNYLTALAKDTINIVKKLGLTKLSQVTGRREFLRVDNFEDAPHLKMLNLDILLARQLMGKQIVPPDGKTSFEACKQQQVTQSKNVEVLQSIKDIIQKGESTKIEVEIANNDLSFGSMIAGEMIRQWPDGYPENSTVSIKATGFGGQKLGFCTVSGLKIHLKGLTNDSPGCAMGGGTLIITPAKEIKNPEKQTVAGNTVAYGATGGQIDILGRVGERCAIRNSGASIVVAGANDFLGEYQTGGEIICLSIPGQEVGAGMTGGLIVIYNPQSLDLTPTLSNNVKAVIADQDELQKTKKRLIIYKQHTDGAEVKSIIDNWRTAKERFVFIKAKS